MKAKTLRRKYILEAIFFLLMARLAVALLPPRSVLAWASRAPRHRRRFSGHEADWVSWAVEEAASKRWVGAVCLPRALAAQAMLRRRGIAGRLCLGVARENDSLVSHAWLEIGSKTVVGQAGRDRFSKISEFSSEADANLSSL
jgi:hypothetical protein